MSSWLTTRKVFVRLQHVRFAKGAALVALFLAAAVSGRALVAQLNYSSEGKRWWNDVKYLADDNLEGRMTGSAGYQIAAGYVAQQFKKEDLKTAGKIGYFQPVHFISRELDEAHSGIELRTNAGVSHLQLGAVVILRPIGEPKKEVSAGMVFAGYGMSVPEAHYDDLAGLDVKGKIVVYLTGGPDSIPDPLRAHEESLGQRWAAMKAAGAIGMASIPNPALSEVPWDNFAANRHRPVLELADASLRHDRGMEVDFTINPSKAEEFFADSGHTFGEVIAAAKAKQPLPHFDLVPKLQARVVTTDTKVESPNVAGVLEGSDPKLKKEYVVVSAHLDHLGKGAPVNGDDIYNGAMDNAAGVAALIQIANDFKVAGTKPKRSVLFLAVCGEEEGELGSWYFANKPTVPRDAIVADINMDMFMPLFPLQLLQVQGLDESTLGGDIRAAGQAAGVKIIEDEQPQANRFIRSDQYSFVQKGIPALAFKFGYVKGSPEEKIFNDWVHTRYHRPSDDADQKVDKDAAGKFCHVIYMLADRVANDPAPPSWEPTSFFRRFAEKDPPTAPSYVQLKNSRLLLAKIPLGTFQMGTDSVIHADDYWNICGNCPIRNDVERPVHQVTISRDFWMGKFPVTQTEWQDVMGNNPSKLQSAGADAPVEQVGWRDVQKFMARVNTIQARWTVRLPTEAEWEYAARAGSTDETYGPLNDIAWYSGNARSSTHPVGQKQPNAFGLYDMLGNVWEWCQDWFGPYSAEPAVDPQGPPTGDRRVTRGGCYDCDAVHERAARRNRDTEDHASESIGFRVVAVPR